MVLKRKFYNLSKRNKGTKGNKSNSVTYSTADFKHKNGSELSCVGYGTNFESNYPGYAKIYMQGFLISLLLISVLLRFYRYHYSI